MVRYIIGDNSSGKTAFLRSLLDSLTTGYITNLWTEDYSKVPFDKRLVEDIEDTYGCDIHLGSIVFISGLGYTPVRGMQEIMSIMLRDVQTYVLDEPELEVDAKDIGILYRVLECMRDLKKDVWLSTHNTELILAEGAEVYTLVSGKLKRVDRKKTEPHGSDIDDILISVENIRLK